MVTHRRGGSAEEEDGPSERVSAREDESAEEALRGNVLSVSGASAEAVTSLRADPWLRNDGAPRPAIALFFTAAPALVSLVASLFANRLLAPQAIKMQQQLGT
jgi:hypothetical protein